MSCADAQDWIAAQGTGLDIPFPEHARHAAHVARCAACSQGLARLDALTDLAQAQLTHTAGEEPARHFVDAARQGSEALPTELVAALHHTPSEAAEQALVAARRPASSPSSWPWALLDLAAAALLVVGWAGRPAPTGAPADGVEAPVAVAPVVPEPAAPMVPEPAAPTQLLQHQGAVTVDGQPLDPARPLELASGSRLETADNGELRFTGDARATITLAANSALSLASWTAEDAHLVLERGQVHADVEPRSEGEQFTVHTPDARVVVVGTRFAVHWTEATGTVVTGEEGRVRVEHLDGTVVGFVEAGDRLVVPERVVAAAPPPEAAPEAPAPVPPLDQARALLGSGDPAQAIALLEALPDGDWERAALLGDAYQLQGSLTLAEAAYTQALEAMNPPAAALLADLARLQEGRSTADAAATWTRYLDHHPTGPEAGHATLTVGSQLLKQGDWDAAEALFTPHADSSGPVAEAATVALIRVHIAKGRKEAALALCEDYWLRFPSPQRQTEVKRLEAVIFQ